MSCNTLVEGYRALDLTDEKGALAGLILADLGVEVIKIEPPGGDPGRRLGILAGHDCPESEKSLSWFGVNASKKGITLNLEAKPGKALFKQLAERAHFVLESFPPGYMDSLGLGYDSISRINPGIIWTSVSPFGQAGPYKDYKGSDIVVQAMGGVMSLTGDVDRAPLRIGYDQAYYIASSYAAMSIMIAHWWRRHSNIGQYIDISISECVAAVQVPRLAPWDFTHKVSQRAGPCTPAPEATGGGLRQVVWPCKDGFVTWWPLGGLHGAKENRALLAWMDEEGFGDTINGGRWRNLDFDTLPLDIVLSWHQPLMNFFAKYSREELERQAALRGVRMIGIRDISEVAQDKELVTRGFWSKVDHPTLGSISYYPGRFLRPEEAQLQPRSRAPMIGEHNGDIYSKEMALPEDEVLRLKGMGVI